MDEWKTIYMYHIVNSCSTGICDLIIERHHIVDKMSIPDLSLLIVAFLNCMKKVNVILQGC